MTSIEKLFYLRLVDSKAVEEFHYNPGQFLEISVPGVGEAPISVCNVQKTPGELQLCIRKVGRVTNAIHRLKEKDLLWLRGPYGNGFPMGVMENHNLLLIAGGLGIAPLRSVLQHALLHRDKYGLITVMYGVRCYSTMLFREEFLKLFREGDKLGVEFLLAYEDKSDAECYQLACERSDRCMSGLVTKLIEATPIKPDNTYAVICGPPVMYKFVVKELTQRHFTPAQIYMTMERRMKCGVGKCGHCITGSSNSIKYVCKDGPVFTYLDALKTRGLL
ncbi:MAG: FAD-binding oxidoreductase [Candidatus Odinarchaeum yellowstonii]|uniref:FAD-binding oxidoreductase n=1 Tax=Odinarchaeota yellowstonii (strain LCB_4) TaxID=1841599 RepID=A0AAF0IC75_ODILC|nr:MAG: FAD-binding oxidoreductase [Candidatus Odinarchaeum yellowstonii]